MTAALPDVPRLVLAGQQHIADILDPETFAKHLLAFLHGPTLRRRTGAIANARHDYRRSCCSTFDMICRP